MRVWLSPVLLVVSPLLLAPAWAKDKVPDRQIPKEVIAGMRLLEHDFKGALAEDCAPERCFSKGCLYVAHSVVDKPTTGSLPGLRLAPKASSEGGQIYLTTAECAFTHERSVRRKDARSLAKRLESKLSRGWTKVKVVYERLQPLPGSIREPPPEPEPEVFEDEPEPLGYEDDAGVEAPKVETWQAPVAKRELWVSLLPHFAWMIALIMLTFIALIVIWAARRLGRQSPEEQLLLAQMLGETSGSGSAEPSTEEAETPESEEQLRLWRERLARSGGRDPALQALVSDLLRTGERALLAKAVTLFPEELPKAFPQGGALASAKFEVASLLKTTDPAALPSDAVFFEKLNRYALASLLTAHSDTDLIRGLHDDFGAAGLAQLVGALPARYGALLFALSPEAMQHEAVSLLAPEERAAIVEQLLRSNRMDPVETAYLLDVLGALRANEALPVAPERRAVSDRGTEFGATRALSVLLPYLDGETRGAYLAAAEVNGRLPTWVQGTLYAEMLLRLETETRNDLLLEAPVEHLAAWLQSQTEAARRALLDGAPNSLRAALSVRPPPTSPAAHFALVNEGRTALSTALQRRLLRGGLDFGALLA